MRITFVLASGYGLAGGERVIASFAKELHARGHTVTLISPPRRPLSWRERWRARRQALRGYAPDVKSHFDQLPMPRRVLESYRPVTDADVPDADIVVATWWETAEWVAGLTPRRGAKAYLIQHHETFDYLPCARRGDLPSAFAQDCFRTVVARVDAKRVWRPVCKQDCNGDRPFPVSGTAARQAGYADHRIHVFKYTLERRRGHSSSHRKRKTHDNNATVTSR